MKKINEKQLMESSRALRDYIDSVIEDGSQAAQSSSDTSRDFSWSNAGKALGNIWQGVKNTTNAIGQAGSDIKSGFTSVQTTSETKNPGRWPTTKDEIIAFQKANVDSKGNPLAPDGLIGHETMMALAKQGIQPPAGFKMAGYKTASKPAQAKPAQSGKPSRASYPNQESDPELDRLNANIASHQQWFDQQKTAKAQAAQQSAQPVPGMQQGMSAASSAITPTFQSQQGVSPSQQLKEKVGQLLKKVNEVNPDIATKTGILKQIGDLYKQGAKDFASDYAQGAKDFAGHFTSEPKDVSGMPTTGQQQPPGYYTSKSFDNKMTTSKASATKDKINSMEPQVVNPQVSTVQPQPSVKTDKISDKAEIALGMKNLNASQISKIQQDLRSKGYEIAVDGKMGPETQQAMDYEAEFGSDYAERINKILSQPISEHTTFQQQDDLFRIIQLSR